MWIWWERILSAFAHWKFYWKFFVSPSSVSNIFTGHRILDWLLFTFTLKITFSHLFSLLFCFWWECGCYFYLWSLVCSVLFSLRTPLLLFIILLFISVCRFSPRSAIRILKHILNLYTTLFQCHGNMNLQNFSPPCCFCMVYKRRKGKILM